jgi:hypothetical protein
MKKSNFFIISLIIIAVLLLANEFKMPQSISKTEDLGKFSTERALSHIKNLSKDQHHIGTSAHAEVKQYLINELKKLDLEVITQDTLVLSKWNNLVKVQNVIAKKKGSNSGKALLLMTHYDSAPQSRAYGASDDANGLGVILEGMRMFMQNKNTFKNDVIILFSDAEEIGLCGAYAFTKHHSWNKNVGVVVNYEARGTSGPSMMMAETNHGNQALIEAFAQAKTPYPVANSLMYSIYKMLPNDTDLTAFREISDIPGYNLAYIDGHYHYHTELDKYENLDPKSVEHQATYFLSLVKHLANTNLNEMNAKSDLTYFSIPKYLVHYPADYNFYLWLIALILFLFIAVLGFGKQALKMTYVLKGFVPLTFTLALAGGLTYGLWQLILFLYPAYNDILCGFTYNGHDYMFAFAFLSVYLMLYFYNKYYKKEAFLSYSFAPLLVWLVITFFIQQHLNGASFIIIPLIFAILSWGLILLSKWQSSYIHLIFAVPAIIIIAPLIQLFPIGLGLKILFGSSILLVLGLTLLLPLLYEARAIKPVSYLMLLMSILFVLKAHFNSDFNEKNPKPNSLIYVSDYHKNQHYWATYNQVLDPWVGHYINAKKQIKDKEPLQVSKYNSGFTYQTPTEDKGIPRPSVVCLTDSISNDKRYFTFEIKANRTINKLELFVPPTTKVTDFKANGVINVMHGKKEIKRKNEGNKLLGYYPIDTLPLYVSFAIDKNNKLEMDVMTTSFDLLNHPKFSVPKRPKNQTPMGFVLTEAILVIERIVK